MVELDMSCRNMHDETLDALMSDLDPAVLQNVIQVDLNGNNLSVEGIQSLIPLIANSGFRWLNISDNQIEGEDLFTKFATSQRIVESADVERDSRLILDEQTRLELLEKIIWLPCAFFGANNPNKNPHGLYYKRSRSPPSYILWFSSIVNFNRRIRMHKKLILCFCLLFNHSLIQIAFAASSLNDEALDTSPTVWRSASQDILSIHKQLQERLHSSHLAEPHNRAIATLYHLNQQVKCDVIDFPLESGEVYKSNHVYSYESDVGADTTESPHATSPLAPALRRHRTEISREIIEKNFKDDRNKLPDNGIKKLKSGMPVEEAKECTEVEKYLTELMQHLSKLKQSTSELKTLRETEADYLKHYPFAKHYKSRMRDSEVSICRDVSDNFKERNESLKRSNKINLHIHSDNNPCFCWASSS